MSPPHSALSSSPTHPSPPRALSLSHTLAPSPDFPSPEHSRRRAIVAVVTTGILALPAGVREVRRGLLPAPHRWIESTELNRRRLCVFFLGIIGPRRFAAADLLPPALLSPRGTSVRPHDDRSQEPDDTTED
ncbi:hypothetical protein VPH35_104743 [Triticum aestivum]